MRVNSRCPLLTALLFAFVGSLSFFLSFSPAEASETIIVNVILNQESKGDFFVLLEPDGDILVKRSDLPEMGLNGLEGQWIERTGEEYLPLRSARGITYAFDEKNLGLEIRADPQFLSKKNVFDYAPRRPEHISVPRDPGAFLNYRLDYVGSDAVPRNYINLTNELGARYSDVLLLTDSFYTDFPGDERYTRLMSRIIYDRRTDMQRFIGGDFVTPSGELGSSVSLGGLSFSKLYQMNPYFYKQPPLNISGYITTPSEVDIYFNGTRIRTEKLSPGEFELKNFYYYGGEHDTQIVIRDAFGREEVIRYPYYFTDALLRRGLNEYSYNIGFLREEFGRESNQYGSLAFSAFHQFGFSDDLTLGLKGEGKSDLVALGPLAAFRLGVAGTINAGFSGSVSEGEAGLAGFLRYLYQNGAKSARAFFAGYTEDYATLGNQFSGIRYIASGDVSYLFQGSNAVSVSMGTLKRYNGEDRDEIAVSYSRPLTQNSTVYATARSIHDSDTDYNFFLGINYYPWRDYTLSARYLQSENNNSETLQAQKNVPIGEGYGYRVSVERRESESETTYLFNPSAQYNARYGTVSGEYFGSKGERETQDSYMLSASGALVYVGKTFGLTRPVYDSFGLVKVADFEGIRVYQNNQEIGRTDASGEVFVPNLNSFYDNQISISDKDIPVEFYLSSVQQYVSPPYRSGSCILFDATRVQAISGRFMISSEGVLKPLSFQEVTIRAGAESLAIATGHDGDFTLENQPPERPVILPAYEDMSCSLLASPSARKAVLEPGTYQAVLAHEGKEYTCGITIPQSDEMSIEVGDIVCQESLPPSKTSGDTGSSEVQPHEHPLSPALQDSVPAPEPAPERGDAGKPDPGLSLPEAGTPLPSLNEDVHEDKKTAQEEARPHDQTGRKSDGKQQGRGMKIATFTVHFPFNGSAPLRRERPVLSEAAKLIRQNNALVDIEGHTDQIGSGKANMRMGMKRARAVLRFLEALGVDKQHIGSVESFGKSMPLCKSLERVCLRQNRRAVITLFQPLEENPPETGP